METRQKIANTLVLIDAVITLGWIIWAGFIFFTSRPGSWKIVLLGLLVTFVFGILIAIIAPSNKSTINADRTQIDSMKGIDFEYYCAEKLKRTGKYRSVEVTPASGDFGADIKATDNNGDLWVFQCKRYSSRLDNTPIQEVVAAKAHYKARHASVITNSSFTKAAKQLANENDVRLIEGDDFDRFIAYDEIFD